MDVTASFQSRLSAQFLDAIRCQASSTLTIGIVNQGQLEHVNELLCCSGYILRVICIPKLDKRRRRDVIRVLLGSQFAPSLLDRITDETASYSAADLSHLCYACLENPTEAHVSAVLDSHHSSFTRRLHAVRSLPGGFSSLYGAQSRIAQVRSGILRPLLHPELYAQYGLQPPAGAVFYGDSGCGKSYMIEAIAEETKNEIQVIEVLCSDLLGKVVNGGDDDA